MLMNKSSLVFSILCIGTSVLSMFWGGIWGQDVYYAQAHAHHRSANPSLNAISGVTGRVFGGQRVRTFTRDRNVTHGVHAGKHSGLASSGKWAVCTTIHKPSEAILSMLDMHGWRVVVVGDEGGAPFQLSSARENLVFLSVEKQKQMEQEYAALAKLLPWKHFGRKNLGFLYAIQHGADVIWDFDDDNILKNGTDPTVRSSEIYEAKTSDGCAAFNPYPLMGAPDHGTPAWPRGFPLNLIRKPCNHTLEKTSFDRVAVLQSLADHEPDVDGIFRLTRVIPFNFDAAKQRTIVVPRWVLTPYNAQATLLMKPAFWSLLLPVTVHGRVSDIWRSYFAQRLMWDVGYQLAFSPPLVTQIRNAHNPPADMQAEQDLYFKSLALVDFLRSWQGTSPHVAGRFEELAIELYERQYIELDDVLLTQQWILALDRAGYVFPPLTDHGSAIAPVQSAPTQCEKTTVVLVTGISGMIGSHVARVLVRKPCHRVYGLVRPRSNLDTLAGVLDQLHLEIGDITDGPRMLDLVEDLRPDFIYHFAAQAINGISYTVPEMTLDTNVIGTMNILEAVRRSGLKTRILLAGSSTEYGRTADVWDGPIPETAPLEPVSPYGVSKVTTENLGHQYFLSFGIPVITARYFIQVGVGGTDSLAIHQFCKQIALAEAGQAAPVLRHGNLKTKRDMTDARDSAPITVALAEKGVPGDAYNIGSGVSMSISDLLSTALAQARVKITAQEDPSKFRVYDEKTLLADISKVQRLTGWKPNTNMTGTVGNILDYWRRRVAVLYPKTL